MHAGRGPSAAIAPSRLALLRLAAGAIASRAWRYCVSAPRAIASAHLARAVAHSAPATDAALRYTTNTNEQQIITKMRRATPGDHFAIYNN